MKSTTPHDPLDDQIAAALHGDLSPSERVQFDSRLANDPAATAAYQEAHAMHDLLEETNRTAQPDANFEQRMVARVRRELANPPQRETAWGSVLFLWKGMKAFLSRKRKLLMSSYCAIALALVVIAVVFARVALTTGGKQAKHNLALEKQRQILLAKASDEQDGAMLTPDRIEALKEEGQKAQKAPVEAYEPPALADVSNAQQGFEKFSRTDDATTPAAVGSSAVDSSALPIASPPPPANPAAPSTVPANIDYSEPSVAATPQGGTIQGKGFSPPAGPAVLTKSGEQGVVEAIRAFPFPTATNIPTQYEAAKKVSKVREFPAATSGPPAPADARKLIRNAQLELEIKSYQTAFDAISALTKGAGGYVDTSSSQRGGNGKLQGTVVIKVLPQNLDGFLLKLRELGDVQNQSVSTDDVTKDYFDTQARLANSQRMETQLQDLLKRENGKVSDLLAVERELGRVRGEIEQMQGQLKLYDFQVQYATVTIQLAEKDLNQAAAYWLREQDNFSLFATDVEGTFQKARTTAEQFKAQVLAANLQHNSGSDVSAQLDVMIAPDQIELFLAQVRGLGRVANFTRQTQRVAKDGGDSDHPADQTLTEKDKVRVQLAIRSDDESRKQVALTVVAKAVDSALQQAKAAALAQAGTEILGSSLNKTPQGASTAQLSVRVPGSEYSALIAAFDALGRQATLSIQRNDNSGPGTNGDDAPVIVSLSLTDNDAPVQVTDMVVIAADVDAGAQRLKTLAGEGGVEIKSSSFAHQPDGTELARMTLRLPMGKYAAFLAQLQGAGKVESLSVQRDDRPDESRQDDSAPVEIRLQLHNQRAIVADNDGLWATLRRTFGEGIAALLGSVRVIGVLAAFLAPWLFLIAVAAWIARRIYVRRRK